MPPDALNYTPIFEIKKPAQACVPFLFNSPHSGRFYPVEFIKQSILDENQIRLSEDAFVDLIYQDVVETGAIFMNVNFPRAFVDVNRSAYELDPAHFCDVPSDFVFSPTLRATAGLGVVPTVVAMNKPLYDKPLPFVVALERVNSFYFPYHDALEAELDNLEKQFGYAVVIDCHSMPSTLKFFDGKKQPDIILGDDNSHSCAPELLKHATNLFCEKGYSVAHNQPYSGGYITVNYGRPLQNRHVLQIEINRDLYMNERLTQLHTGFEKLHIDIMSICADLVSLPEKYFVSYQHAAE